MGPSSRFHIGAFAFVVLLAGLNVVHAMYFDWSDVDVHGVVAIACVLIAIRWRKLAIGIVSSLAIAVALSWLFDPEPVWTQQVQTGDRVADVQALLGRPTHEFTSLAEARRQPIGYSVPSPVRFRHSGPVTVYIRGEHALWVFRNEERVTATFVGGS